MTVPTDYKAVAGWVRQERRGVERVCPDCAHPVTFTLRYPGKEYVCEACGWLGDMFAPVVREPAAEGD